MTGSTNRSRVLLVLAGVAALLATLVAGLGLGRPGTAHAATISAAIRDYSFQPAALTVQPGDTVTWTNYDDAPHTVTTSSGPEAISSPTLQKGQSYSFTFTKPGVDHYYCSVHPQMTGSVTVTSGTSSSSSGSTGTSPDASAPGSSGPGSGGQPGGTSGSGGYSQPPSSAPSAGSPSAPGSAPAGSAMGPMPSGSGSSCTNQVVLNAMLDPFINHMYRAHLERSPGQQANDLLNVNQYVLTHTVLVEDMVAPAIAAVQAALNGIVPFTNHMYRAHLERSPGQQVNDALNVSQYVQTHTVLVEDWTAPAVQSLEGSYGC